MESLKVKVVLFACPRGASIARRQPSARLISFAATVGSSPFRTPSRQMRQEGKPSYDGEFMCWREGRVFAHCGNLDLPQLLLYLASHEQAERFYLFTYPYWTEDHTAKYYRFDLSETAIKGAGIYRESNP